MRIFLCLIYASFLPFTGIAQAEEFRQLYFSTSSREGKQKFYDKTRPANEKDPVQLAYQGTATAMYAELADNVKNKFTYFNTGKDAIELAVSLSPKNPEIAFLRFSVQSEVPRFLGYRANISSDSNLILGALKAKQIDPKDKFWSQAIKFMQSSGELNKLQLAELNKYITQ